MSKKPTKIIRKTVEEVPKSTPEELDRLAHIPEGTPDEENPEWTPEQIAAAKAGRHRIAKQAERTRKHGSRSTSTGTSNDGSA